MDIEVSATPDVDLVIHVIEMGSTAEGGGHSLSPGLAIDAIGGITSSGLIEQGKIRVVGIGGQLGGTVRLQPVPRIRVVLIDAALCSILSHRKAPVTVGRGRNL